MQSRLQFINLSFPLSRENDRNKSLVRRQAATFTHAKARKTRVLQYQQNVPVETSCQHKLPPCSQSSQISESELSVRKVLDANTSDLTTGEKRRNLFRNQRSTGSHKIVSSTSPLVIIGSVRVNPFDSYAVPVTPFEHSLIEHCMQFVTSHPLDLWNGGSQF